MYLHIIITLLKTSVHVSWFGCGLLNHSISFVFCRVMCECGLCGSKKQTLSEWERHTGCRAKKWKFSVKVKSTMLPLENWVCIPYLNHVIGSFFGVVFDSLY